MVEKATGGVERGWLWPGVGVFWGMKKSIVFLIAFVFAGLGVSAQTPNARPDTAMVRFFSGNWKGEGKFANGRPIEATVSFRLSLDSAWLVCEHRDVPPNGYAADFYWGVDRDTKAFEAYCFDNFNGHRHFGSNGWLKGRIVLTTQASAGGGHIYFEHFIFEKVTEGSFRMTYEVSGDGITWQLGDSLVFTRR